MFLYGVLILLVGMSLIGGVTGLAVGLHRRYGLPYALLTVGILTYIPALMIQILLSRAFDRALLDILPVGALVLGILAGFTEELARFFGYQYLARNVATRPQALMIGLGHSLPAVAYTALIALGFGISLLGYGTERPDDLNILISGAAAEALNGILPVVMHMALSWMVLQVFLRGVVGWLFVAIFAHSIAAIMATSLGPADSWAVVVWRGIVALISLAAIRWVSPPQTSPP